MGLPKQASSKHSCAVIDSSSVLNSSLAEGNRGEGGRFADKASSTSAVRYVSPSGVDSGDCRDLSQPCRTIQYAINKANSGDIIKVAQGVYSYDALVDPCHFLLTRAVVCVLDKSVTVEGGYRSSDWSAPVEDPSLTTIDAQRQYRGVANIGYNAPQSTHMTLRHFTIKNALVSGPTYLTPYDPSGVGAGMLVQHASVNLENIVFENNEARGGNTTFGSGGQADGAGLRIEVIPEGKFGLLRRVVFRNNRSLGGSGPERGGVAFGALFIYRGNVIIEDAVFENNLAKGGNSTGSGNFGAPPNADGLGGAIGLEKGNLVLRRVQIIGNSAIGGDASQVAGTGYGGGIFVEDFDGNETEVVIEDSLFFNNVARGGQAIEGGGAVGGALASANVIVKIERSRFISNTAIGGNSTNGSSAGPGAGGGLYLFAERAGRYDSYLINSLVVSNSVRPGIGGSPRGLGNGGGGGLVIHGKRLDLVFSTISQNSVATNQVLGQAVLVQPWPSPLQPQLLGLLNLSDSIVEGHVLGHNYAAALVVQQGSTAVLRNVLFANNLRHTNQSNIPVNSGTFIILGNVIVLPWPSQQSVLSAWLPSLQLQLAA